METLDIKSLLLYGLGTALAISYFRSRQQSTIPALGGTSGISSYLAALRLFRHPDETILSGYLKDRNGVFRIPMFFRWDYLASGPQRLREIASVSEDILSFHEGVDENLQTRWTMGPEIVHDPYHVLAIRGSLTRNLSRCFPEVRDEIVNAFDDVLALEGEEWKLITVLPAAMQVVGRTSNRLFVGLPLCRVPEYVQLNIDFTVTIFARGQLIRLLPEFLKPVLAPILSSRKSSLRHALKFLKPILDERLEQENKFGRDRPDRPNDLISWLLDDAVGEERTTPALAMRVLVTNMGAIHTSSTTLTAALFDLALYPAHIGPMREEAERVIAQEGWTKAALGSMHKIDSFLRESQRLRGSSAVAMTRKVVAKDGFAFTDGTTIPYGAFLCVPATPVHLDTLNYDQPEVFDGFRFSRIREAARAGPDHTDDDADADSGEGNAKDQKMFNLHMIATGTEHLVFGHGRHACPGRFFAATELKAMLAHILINYDVKAEVEGVRPPDMEFGMFRMPNANGKIWMRKREEV